MSRLGFKCDECGEEYHGIGPAGVVQEDGEWRELCDSCYVSGQVSMP